MPGETGYIGIGPEAGIYVPDVDAYAYAIDRCLYGTETEVKEFREMLVDWYYSGNWIKKED